MKIEFLFERMHAVGTFCLVVDGRREVIRATLDPIKDMDLILERTQSSLDAVGSDIPINYDCPWWGKFPQIPKSRMPIEEPKPPTIAELWREMQAAIEDLAVSNECIEMNKRMAGNVANTVLVESILLRHNENRDSELGRIQALRAALLERCKDWIKPRKNGTIYVEVRFLPSNPTPDDLRKCAAIYEFAAWEIEQRAKEKV